MPAIISKDERTKLQRAKDAADLAEARAALARHEPEIPNQRVAALLDVDDATFADLIAAFRERGESGIRDDELVTMVRTQAARNGA